MGSLVASVTVRVAQWERRAIGRMLGRPRQLPDNVRSRIHHIRGQGLSLRAIADTLNGEGVPTAQGGARWYPSTIRAVLATETL